MRDWSSDVCSSDLPLRNRHRVIIFTNIVRIEPSNGERFQSRMPDRRQIIAIEHAPFWQAASRNREAMGQDRTLGLFQRYPHKPHFDLRSEEHRVGITGVSPCRYWWAREH